MIFKNGYKITQLFGNNPSYYDQWDFNGHEGIDLIPNDSDWNVYLPEDGVVVRDTDTPRDNYGNFVTVWNKKNKRAWWFCHLSKNNVKLGQELKAGTIIGVMGNTGNSSGPHLHLGVRESDANGNAINLDNGFKGFINPLPILQKLNEGDLQDENQVLNECKSELDEMRESRNKWKSDFKNLEEEFKKLTLDYKAQEVALEDSRADIEVLQKKIIRLQETIATNKTPLSAYSNSELFDEVLRRVLGKR